MQIIEPAGRWDEPDDTGATFVEHLARPDLSLGTYSLRAGALDTQSPHTEDEIYVVTAGRAQFTSGGRTVPVAPGAVLFVPAHERHHFHDITDDLALLVLFGPAYGSRAAGRSPQQSGMATAAQYPDLDPAAGEPEFDDLAQMREHRKRRLALGYRIFGAMRYGSLGDGHITARDPERTDHFWLARYGVPFGQVTVDDLVLVAPDGSVAEGHGWINPAAYFIHAPIHEARPDVVSAAHTHTPYGTPFAARARLLDPISQESCTFFEDHALFDDEEVDIASTDGGKRIAAALGATKAVILRNHGPLTVGTSVDSAVGFFLQFERAAEVQVKIHDAQPISAAAARAAFRQVGSEQTGRQLFEWLLRTTVPDPDVVLTAW